MLNKVYFKCFYSVLLSLVLVFNCLTFATKISPVENVNSPDNIPFFDEKGEKCFLDQFEGKTILLVFWATWCASCTKEMPDLDGLQKDFRKIPFEVIAVSQDFQGINIIKEYFKNLEIRYLKIYHDRQNQLFKAFSVVGLPTSFLIDKDGKIVYSFTGAINWYDEGIRKIILSYIEGNYLEPKNSYKAQDLNKTIKSTTNNETMVNPSENLILDKNDNQPNQDQKVNKEDKNNDKS